MAELLDARIKLLWLRIGEAVEDKEDEDGGILEPEQDGQPVHSRGVRVVVVLVLVLALDQGPELGATARHGQQVEYPLKKTIRNLI